MELSEYDMYLYGSQEMKKHIARSSLDIHAWMNNSNQPYSNVQVLSTTDMLPQERYLQRTVQQSVHHRLKQDSPHGSDVYDDVQVVPVTEQTSSIQDTYYSASEKQCPVSSDIVSGIPVNDNRKCNRTPTYALPDSSQNFHRRVISNGFSQHRLTHDTPVAAQCHDRGDYYYDYQQTRHNYPQPRAVSNGFTEYSQIENDDVTSTTINSSCVRSPYWNDNNNTHNNTSQINPMTKQFTDLNQNLQAPITLKIARQRQDDKTDSGKRHRFPFNTQQIILLERAYVKKGFLTYKDRQTLSKQLNVNDERLKDWFKMRRINEIRQKKRCDDMRSAELNKQLEYVEALVGKPDRYGIVTLDHKAVTILCSAITDCLQNYKELCEVNGSSIIVIDDDDDGNSQMSSSNSEQGDVWEPPRDRESLNRLYNLHFC